ncbi:MAG: TIGR04211 family SH3 domain-containing protein [Ferrimonas sp.]
MFIRTCILLVALFSLPITAAPRIISEDLEIYLLAGPSTQYRILGTLKAGEAATTLGETSAGYSKIRDGRGREGWVLTKDLRQGPSFRTLLPETQAKLASTEANLAKTTGELALLKSQYERDQNNSLEALSSQRQRVETQAARINELEQSNAQLQQQLASQQNNERWTWLKQGGMIAAGGLLLGLIIAHLPRPSRRRQHHNYIR